MQTTEAYPPHSIGFIAVYGNVPTRRATTVSTSTTLKFYEYTVMATYKRYKLLYRNHDFSLSVAPLPSEKVPLARVLTGKNFSASVHSKRRSAGKPTRVEGPKGLIKGLYRSQPGRRALISLVHPAPFGLCEEILIN
ncbi:hypothetical protein ALC62_05839 [Cyphomyrmex costatus]|uniref:Uncharacterized protein n=1 Tax=Cyphomyrmex costatus TaxID=456900 RepID=A0A151IJE9_9HYME|nr:hypothetical protein ALC62_05839 [Cyphomyrmex costatus]